MVPEIQSFLYATPSLSGFPNLTIIRPESETWPQNQLHNTLITQSTQATADAITSALTARMASISLPIIYNWDSQDA